MGGANDGGYLKPLIDNYGYKKTGFYTIKSAFQDVCAFVDGVNIKIGGNFAVKPVLFGEAGKTYDVVLSVTDKNGNILDSYMYNDVSAKNRCMHLSEFVFEIKETGFYGISLEVKEKENR